MSDYSVLLTVAVAEGAQQLSPAAWHGWLYKALGPMADSYHQNGTPPFSLRPVDGWNVVRFALLDGALAGHLAVRGGLLGPEERMITSAQWELFPYEQLLAPVADPRVTLRFITPVAFKQGSKTTPLPLPQLVFPSLSRIWQRFVPCGLSAFTAQDYAEGVQILDVELASRKVSVGFGEFTGCIGRVTYKALSPEIAETMHALAGLAALAGVGIKRALGMGAVERLLTPGSYSERHKLKRVGSAAERLLVPSAHSALSGHCQTIRVVR